MSSAPFEHKLFDILRRGSREFLWFSHPSERNHWNHHLLWNSSAPSLLSPQTIQLASPGQNTLACMCVCVCLSTCAWLQACVCVYHCTSTSTFVFPACVCETLCASWVVSRPEYVAYCISSWGRSRGCCCAEAGQLRAWFSVRRGPDVTDRVFGETSPLPRGRQQPLKHPAWLCWRLLNCQKTHSHWANTRASKKRPQRSKQIPNSFRFCFYRLEIKYSSQFSSVSNRKQAILYSVIVPGEIINTFQGRSGQSSSKCVTDNMQTMNMDFSRIGTS